VTSLASRLADLEPEERRELLAGFTEEQKQALFYDWDFWAREEQKYPPGDWLVWLLLAGRGSGKSRVGSETVRRWTKHHARIALIAETAGDARDVIVEGESGILAVHPEWERPHYEPSKRRLTWPNGCIATTYSGKEPDQLRGPQHEVAWVDELAKYQYPQETWDNLMFGLRLGAKPRVVVTTTPRPIPIVKELVSAPGTHLTKGTTFDNLDNLAPTFREAILARYEGTTLGRQELYAEIIDDVEGALWTRTLIEEHRILEAPELQRIVVGVDPSGSTTTECGIVLAGRDQRRDRPHYYVIDDRSIAASPEVRMRQAVAAYHSLRADRMVGERNYGGDQIEALIRQVDPDVSYKDVQASRGKMIRAEPVAALAEQGRLHHVGTFGPLEDEMCSYDGTGPSPNRLDAMVFAVTELMEHGGPAAATVATGHIADW
jgi:phage terminase large subunit-like protein